jgi:hypothetical protein
MSHQNRKLKVGDYVWIPPHQQVRWRITNVYWDRLEGATIYSISRVTWGRSASWLQETDTRWSRHVQPWTAKQTRLLAERKKRARAAREAMIVRKQQVQVIEDALLELGVPLSANKAAYRRITIELSDFFDKLLPVIQKGKTR